jgi:hypothetical protein
MTTKKLLTFALTTLLLSSGCVRTIPISSDRQVHRMKAGMALTPTVDGWFVPDVVWIELNAAAEANNQ